MNPSSPSSVTVRDIDIPFGRLVAVLLKLMLAAIPAMILFYLIAFFFIFIVIAVFGSGAALFR
jgi:hypothetical protein